MSLANIVKSKTINFNVLVPAVVGIASAFGFTVPAEVVAGILAVGNFVLRFFTKEPLSAK